MANGVPEIVRRILEKLGLAKGATILPLKDLNTETVSAAMESQGVPAKLVEMILADLKAGGATIVPLGKIKIDKDLLDPIELGLVKPCVECDCTRCRRAAEAAWN